MLTKGYWIFQCKKCGRWGVKEVRKRITTTFTCKFCNKKYNIYTEARYGLNLNYRIDIVDRHEVPFNNSKDAGIKCRELNKNASKIRI